MDAKRYFVPTPHGAVSLVFAAKPRDRVMLVIHGAGRRAFQLRGWLALDVVFAELPGHDLAPMMGGDLATYAEAFNLAVEQVWPGLPLTVVGESLGGIVALHMRADRKVLIDPPMQPTTEVETELRVGFVAEWLKPHLRVAHWPLLDAQEAPLEVVCASRSILPPDAIKRLGDHPRVRLSVIDGGHVLMDDNPEGVARILAGHQDQIEPARAARA